MANIDPNESIVLNTGLYSCKGSELIIYSMFWAIVEFNNDAKSEVVDFIYKDEDVPRSGNLPGSIVVRFY